jgi:hypothetical protein
VARRTDEPRPAKYVPLALITTAQAFLTVMRTLQSPWHCRSAAARAAAAVAYPLTELLLPVERSSAIAPQEEAAAMAGRARTNATVAAQTMPVALLSIPEEWQTSEAAQ